MKRPHLLESNRLVGVVGRRQWELAVVLSCGENWRTDVLCFVLYIVYLYELGCFVTPFLYCFRISECHVSFKAELFCCDVYTTQMTWKQNLFFSLEQKAATGV